MTKFDYEGDGSDCGDGAGDELETADPDIEADRPPKETAKRRTSRRRTSKYCGVCSANRKNQWQARILMMGKVTHLGYFDSEEEAARIYDIVSLSLHKDKANTNFPETDYRTGEFAERASKLIGMSREELQRSLGVKPIRKTSRFNGVSKKRGKWVAKVMIDKKLVYHASFEDEREAAMAYDSAVRRLKPNKAHAYVNFKEPPPSGGTMKIETVPVPEGSAPCAVTAGMSNALLPPTADMRDSQQAAPGLCQGPHAGMMKHGNNDPQQLWASDTSSMDPNQWLWHGSHRGMSGVSPAYPGLTHMSRPMKDDIRGHQMPQGMWDHKSQMPHNTMPHRDALRNHVQHLIQPPGLGIMPERQSSSLSSWSHQYPCMPGESEVLSGRGFPSAAHQWN
eukprot:scaffold400751_cov42-Prasinocladus_malaysianus.AAC.1